MEYPKIQTIFKRDAKNIIIPGNFTRPEFAWLQNCKFRAEEKIDGTNVRIEINIIDDGSALFSFEGRTSRAVLPPLLIKRLDELFTSKKVSDVFGDKVGAHITLYGEGYGYKIQGGGGYIHDNVDFILFDVKVDDWWLCREHVEDIAKSFGIKVVPVVGYFNIAKACEYVADGFKSGIAEDPNKNAEGLVLKTPDNLQMRSGERIVLKVKTTDFTKWKNIYGENNIHFFHDINGNVTISTDVEQEINTLYK